MEEIGDDIDVRTNYKVQNIDYSNEEYVQITALHNGILHFIQADHVISTVSLGRLQKTNFLCFMTKKSW